MGLISLVVSSACFVLMIMSLVILMLKTKGVITKHEGYEIMIQWFWIVVGSAGVVMVAINTT